MPEIEILSKINLIKDSANQDNINYIVLICGIIKKPLNKLSRIGLGSSKAPAKGRASGEPAGRNLGCQDQETEGGSKNCKATPCVAANLSRRTIFPRAFTRWTQG